MIASIKCGRSQVGENHMEGSLALQFFFFFWEGSGGRLPFPSPNFWMPQVLVSGVCILAVGFSIMACGLLSSCGVQVPECVGSAVCSTETQ